MGMRKKIWCPLMCGIVLLMATMTSCSKKGELLATLPADVTSVAVVDVKGILEASGCKFTPSCVVLPPSITDIDSDEELLVAMGRLDAAGVCSFDDVAVVLDKSNRTIFTFLVSDGEKFKALTSSFDWKDGEDGYSEGVVKGSTILTDGKQAWIVTHGNAYEGVKKLREGAKDMPLTKLAGVKGALEQDNLVNAAFSGLGLGFLSSDGNNPEEKVWNILTANVKDNKIIASSQSMKGDGDVVETKGMQPINPAVLAYIPGNCNVVLGAGLTSEFDWKGLISALAPFTVRDFQMQGMIAMLTPFLQALDGTVIFAAGPANDNAYSELEPENWQFMLMAHMPQEKINQVMGMIRTAMFQGGISPSEGNDGIMVVPQYGMNFYVGNVDGYLAISNFPFDNTRQNSLAPIFVNKNAAAAIEIPSLQMLSSGAPSYGVMLTVGVEDSKGNAELSLPGSDKPILETILNSIYD